MVELPGVVVLDANTLICLCEGDGDRKLKLEYLIERLDKRKAVAVLPTPAIAEYLTYAEAAGLAVLTALRKKSCIVIGDFDIAAAYECSQLTAAAQGRGNKRDGVEESWQKIKIDRQIVAIAKAHGANLIISDDAGVRSAAARIGLEASSIDDLPFPDDKRQQNLPISDEASPHPA